jgi:hypothetical protein
MIIICLFISVLYITAENKSTVLVKLDRFILLRGKPIKTLKQTFKFAFTYLWFDKTRKMFYIGMHEGNIDDGYVASSRWFSGERQYRPNEFTRKILKIFDSRATARKEEARLLRMIKETEYGKRYYNLKNGRPSGSVPWNKGKKNIYSQETIDKMSSAKKGKPSNFTKNK